MAVSAPRECSFDDGRLRGPAGGGGPLRPRWLVQRGYDRRHTHPDDVPLVNSWIMRSVRALRTTPPSRRQVMAKR